MALIDHKKTAEYAHEKMIMNKRIASLLSYPMIPCFIAIVFFYGTSYSQTTKISGKILGAVNKKESIYIRQILDYSLTPQFVYTNLDSAETDSLGNFSLAWILKAPGPITMSYGKNSIELFLKPSDSLYVECNYPFQWQRMVCRGSSSMENNLLLAIGKCEESRKKIKRKYDQTEPNKFLQQNDSIKALEEILSKGVPSISSAFSNYLRNEIQYHWANEHFLYIWKRYNTMIKVGDKLPLDSLFFHFLKQVPISNDSALENKIYYTFLDSYLHYQMPQYFTGQYIEKPVKNFHVEKFEQADKCLQKKVAWVAKERILHEAEQAHIPEKDIQKLKESLENSILEKN